MSGRASGAARRQIYIESFVWLGLRTSQQWRRAHPFCDCKKVSNLPPKPPTHTHHRNARRHDRHRDGERARLGARDRPLVWLRRDRDRERADESHGRIHTCIGGGRRHNNKAGSAQPAAAHARSRTTANPLNRAPSTTTPTAPPPLRRIRLPPSFCPTHRAQSLSNTVYDLLGTPNAFPDNVTAGPLFTWQAIGGVLPNMQLYYGEAERGVARARSRARAAQRSGARRVLSTPASSCPVGPGRR